MSVSLDKIGRRFNDDWIFRNLNHTISSENPCVISGSNGSGKSTLLMILSGQLSATEGIVSYNLNGTMVEVEEVFRDVTIAAPYVQLYEEFTLVEAIKFQSHFKAFRKGIDENALPSLLNLEREKDKFLKYYSSGMKQRVKLGLAVLSDSPILLLDEPLSHLDVTGIEWYKNLISEHKDQRSILVCSNSNQDEHFFCSDEINMEDYRQNA